MHLQPFIKIPFLLALSLWVSGAAWAQVDDSMCGPITNAFGPYDFRTERGNNLHLVESAHFTASVESLTKAVTGYIGQDIDYTLRAFPNHHRALMTVIRYGEKKKSAQPPDLKYTIECYFNRAIRFRPNDTLVRMIYATYLNKNKRTPEAIQQLDIGAQEADSKENPLTHYNLGLLYLESKEYEKSLIQAHKAYGIGFIQPELKEKLKEAGKWTDPEVTAPTSSVSSPTPSN